MDGRAHTGVAAVAVHADRNILAAFDLLQVLQELVQEDELAFYRLTSPPVCRLGFVDVPVQGQLCGDAIRGRHSVGVLLDAHGRLVKGFAHITSLSVSVLLGLRPIVLVLDLRIGTDDAARFCQKLILLFELLHVLEP